MAGFALRSSTKSSGTEIYCVERDNGRKDCGRHQVAVIPLFEIVSFLNAYGTVITALSTVAVAVFTGTLWWTTGNLLDAGERTAERQAALMEAQNRIILKQVRLGEKQHIATHRPRLIVRRCMILISDKQCEILFEVFNAGGSSARILPASKAVVRMMSKTYQPFIMEKSGGLHHSILEGQTLLAGDVVVGNIPCGIDPHEWESFMASAYSNPTATVETVVFYGRIVYSDENGVVRRTGFWRTYDGPSGVFQPANHADYEFED